MTSLQYVTLKETKTDPNFNTVFRERINFVYNNLAYSIEVYHNILGQDRVYLLRFSTKAGENPLSFVPPFLEFVQDVINDKNYKLREIARKKE